MQLQEASSTETNVEEARNQAVDDTHPCKEGGGDTTPHSDDCDKSRSNNNDRNPESCVSPQQEVGLAAKNIDSNQQ